MGHRHSPEKVCNAGSVFGVDGGVAAADGDTVVETVEVPGLESLPTGQQRGVTLQAGAEKSVCATRARSVGTRAGLFVLRFYKAYLSTLFAGSCRFEPTCSQYSYEAVERFGFARGSWLTLKRLLRCQPLSRKFGYDPVPENWEELSSEALAQDVCHSAPASHEVHT